MGGVPRVATRVVGAVKVSVALCAGAGSGTDLEAAAAWSQRPAPCPTLESQRRLGPGACAGSGSFLGPRVPSSPDLPRPGRGHSPPLSSQATNRQTDSREQPCG